MLPLLLQLVWSQQCWPRKGDSPQIHRVHVIASLPMPFAGPRPPQQLGDAPLSCAQAMVASLPLLLARLESPVVLMVQVGWAPMAALVAPLLVAPWELRMEPPLVELPLALVDALASGGAPLQEAVAGKAACSTTEHWRTVLAMGHAVVAVVAGTVAPLVVGRTAAWQDAQVVE